MSNYLHIFFDIYIKGLRKVPTSVYVHDKNINVMIFIIRWKTIDSQKFKGS